MWGGLRGSPRFFWPEILPRFLDSRTANDAILPVGMTRGWSIRATPSVGVTW